MVLLAFGKAMAAGVCKNSEADGSDPLS